MSLLFLARGSFGLEEGVVVLYVISCKMHLIVVILFLSLFLVQYGL